MGRYSTQQIKLLKRNKPPPKDKNKKRRPIFFVKVILTRNNRLSVIVMQSSEQMGSHVESGIIPPLPCPPLQDEMRLVRQQTRNNKGVKCYGLCDALHKTRPIENLKNPGRRQLDVPNPHTTFSNLLTSFPPPPPHARGLIPGQLTLPDDGYVLSR